MKPTSGRKLKRVLLSALCQSLFGLFVLLWHLVTLGSLVRLLWRFWWLSIGANLLHKLFLHGLLLITQPKSDPFLYWQYHCTYEQNTEQRPLSANTILLSFALPWQILSLKSLIDMSGKILFSYMPTFRWSLHLWLGHPPQEKGSIQHCLGGECWWSLSGIGHTVR